MDTMDRAAGWESDWRLSFDSRQLQRRQKTNVIGLLVERQAQLWPKQQVEILIPTFLRSASLEEEKLLG
jgi:hypothetical protein